MENKTFALEILTSDRKVYSGEVVSFVAPGFEGYFGVLARHAPLIAAIGVGEIRIRTAADEERLFATSGGFAEVLPNKVTVLSEAAEEATEIDVARAEAAKDRAMKRLQEGRKAWDVQRAEAALARAMNRLRVAGKVLV